jgi:hypothetical protein
MRPLAAAIAFLCAAAPLLLGAAHPADAPKAQQQAAEAQRLAPDGVPYDNEDSQLLMQLKPLSGNLVQNGSFEGGRYWPYGWQATDGLTTFWVPGGTDGQRCLRIYTDVLDAQWNAREQQVRAAVEEATAKSGGQAQALPQDPVPPAPERRPTSPPYYDTVAGVHGVHYRSDYVKVQPGAIYRFCIDARTEAEGEPKVFVKGFFDQKLVTKDGYQVVRRDAYDSQMALDPCDGQWRRYARELHPSLSKSTLGGKPLKPEWLQVQIYGYWKPGNYYFDNVRLEVVGMEEPQPEPKPQPPAAARPEPAPRPLGEDEFPVFNP